MVYFALRNAYNYQIIFTLYTYQLLFKISTAGKRKKRCSRNQAQVAGVGEVGGSFIGGR